MQYKLDVLNKFYSILLGLETQMQIENQKGFTRSLHSI